MTHTALIFKSALFLLTMFGSPVDERCGEVGTIVAQLSRLVVPREHVMVVVPALAESANRYGHVVSCANVSVIE